MHQTPRSWITLPRQGRSHRTLERVLVAADTLFTERGYEHTSVADVVKAAGSSVGAFYARFPDKTALLRCVLERSVDQAAARISELARPELWRGVPTREVLRAALRLLILACRERHRLIAAFSAVPADPAHTGFVARISDVVTASAVALLAARGEPAAARRRELGFGVWTILSVLESRSLRGFDDGTAVSDDEMADQSTAMLVGYLGLV